MIAALQKRRISRQLRRPSPKMKQPARDITGKSPPAVDAVFKKHKPSKRAAAKSKLNRRMRANYPQHVRKQLGSRE